MTDKERVLAVHPQARLRMHGSNKCAATYPQVWVDGVKIGEGHADERAGWSAWEDAARSLRVEDRP